MEHILEGNISVKAALLSQRRVINQIMVDPHKHDRDTAFILRHAKARKIPVIFQERKQIDAFASGKTHGGMIAFCEERSFQSILQYKDRNKVFLALIEGVEDPFNFGYVLRSLYAAGCDGVIIPKRNWTSAAGIVAKASAGASEYMDLIVAETMETVLEECRNQNIRIVCALRNETSKNVYTYTFPDKLCLAIGGELRGLSKTIRMASDENIYIPYANDFRNAMTAASSCAILAFERLRQIQKNDEN